MNHCVPDFEMDEYYSIPTSSGLARPKKSPVAEDEIMELLWQNGQVVMQSQNQRPIKRLHIGDGVLPAEQSAEREIRPEEQSATTRLFMQEDEMASWLQYPIDDSSFDRDFYADLIYPSPCAPAGPRPRTSPILDLRTMDVRALPPSTVVGPPPRQPIPPPRRADVEYTARFQNFAHFSRPRGVIEPGQSISNKAAGESTVVDSSETPAAMGLESMASQVSGANVWCGSMSGAVAGGVSSAAGGGGRERGTCELTVTSSTGGSGASVRAGVEPIQKPLPPPPPPPPLTEDRKRKGREAEDTECQSEDAEFESPDAKKQVRGSTSTKRSRAAEVHNLSERRRRDRINEKMRALQELIPRCNKSDKASMLDEAIEYLKSLQRQIQMMSMGCGVVPMMFPGIQHCMPAIGMRMGMGMSRPMVPFPSVLAGSSMPTPASATHLGPRFPMPAFDMPPVPLPDPSRIQASSQSDPTMNSTGTPNQPGIPNFPDPYQQYLSLQSTQIPLPQTQAMMQPSSSNVNRDAENNDNLQSG